MTIPQEVIEKDRALQAAVRGTHLQLDQLRWEQCSDPKGPRLDQSEYAEAVGLTQSAISKSVNSWATALLAQNPAISDSPGMRDREHGKNAAPAVEAVAAAIEAGQDLAQPSPEVHKKARATVRHSKTNAPIVTALALAFGVGTEIAARSKLPDWPARRKEVAGRAAIYQAQDGDLSWEDACTKAADELARETKMHAKAADIRAKESEQAKARKDLRYIEIEGDAAAAKRHLTKMLAVSRSTDLDPDHIELITGSTADLRALLGLIDMAVSGSTHVDWDSELAKLGGAM